MNVLRLLTSGKKCVAGIAAFVGIPVTVFFLSCLISGCAVGPKYERPKLGMPERLSRSLCGANQKPNSFADLPWWQVFHDDALQSLVQVARSRIIWILRIAVSRVEQARQLAVEARADLFPQVGYSGVAARGRNVGVNNTPSPTGTTGSSFRRGCECDLGD